MVDFKRWKKVFHFDLNVCWKLIISIFIFLANSMIDHVENEDLLRTTFL